MTTRNNTTISKTKLFTKKSVCFFLTKRRRRSCLGPKFTHPHRAKPGQTAAVWPGMKFGKQLAQEASPASCPSRHQSPRLLWTAPWPPPGRTRTRHLPPPPVLATRAVPGARLARVLRQKRHRQRISSRLMPPHHHRPGCHLPCSDARERGGLWLLTVSLHVGPAGPRRVGSLLRGLQGAEADPEADLARLLHRRPRRQQRGAQRRSGGSGAGRAC